MSIDWTLYLVTDPDLAGGRDNVVSIVQEAVRGGVTVVQLGTRKLAMNRSSAPHANCLAYWAMSRYSSMTA